MVIILSLLLFASFTLGLTARIVYADNAVLSIPSVTKNASDVGTNFTVPIQISNVTDMFGFDINITWDNTLISFVDCNYITTLNTVWPSGCYVQQNTTGVNGNMGWYRLVAVSTSSGFTTSGSQTLFTLTLAIVEGDNFPHSTSIHFNMVKLSDSNADPIPVTLNDGTYSISAAVPGIKIAIIDPDPSKPFVYGKSFELQVNATEIKSTLVGFDLTVDYSAEFLAFHNEWISWGVLGTGNVDNSTAGSIHVWIGSSLTPYVGNNDTLFTLTFQVQFDSRIGHIWTKHGTQNVQATISLDNTTGNLGFGTEGTLYISLSQIITPSAFTLTIHLIQGDVNCDGKVDIYDLQKVAQYYDKTSSDPSWSTIQKYDLTNDGTIDIYDLVVVAANFWYGY